MGETTASSPAQSGSNKQTLAKEVAGEARVVGGAVRACLPCHQDGDLTLLPAFSALAPAGHPGSSKSGEVPEAQTFRIKSPGEEPDNLFQKHSLSDSGSQGE